MESDTGSLLLFFVFILLGGLVVLCQNAVIELPDAKLRRLPDNGRTRQLLRLLESPSRFQSAMRGGYTFFHLCAVVCLEGWAATLVLPGAFWGEPWGALLRILLVLFVATFFILTVSRGIPRRIAAEKADGLAATLAPLAAFFKALFTPIAWLSDAVSRLLLPIFGVRSAEHHGNVTEEEIRMMVDVSEETGGIEQLEKDMINAVFEFDDRTADQMMTHRTDVKYLEQDATLEEVIAATSEYGFSRMPVVGEDGLDDIVGILNVKDLLPLLLADRRKRFSVMSYIRQPLYVPESGKARDLFARLNAEKTQVAVVVDEYGGTSGLVTMEDILESLVGDIQDEYDHEEEEATALDQNRYTLDGDIDLPEVERILEWDLSRCPEYGDYDTLGGLIIGLLDQIPGPDQHPSVNICGVEFTVEDANERQILRILAEKPLVSDDE